MRIAIDYTSAIAQGAGIGRYTRSLTNALAALNDNAPANDTYTLFSSERPTAQRPFPQSPVMRPRVVPLGNRRLTILWQRLHAPLPAELLMGAADVLHGPDFVLPPTIRMRRIVTIHDLAFLTHPQYTVPSLAAYLTSAVPRAAHIADHIITPSERTATDLIERLGVSRAKITVIHLGIDPTIATARPSQEAIAALRAKYGFQRPTVLAVSTLEPRKNFVGLITAFAQATQKPDGPRMLVIAGRKGWLYDDIFATVERYQLTKKVQFLDYVPDAELPVLYHAADALAMPSFYEGFGIPVAEAMASNLPVVCSDTGALPEIAGDAALLVHPNDIDALANALTRIISDTPLRQTLIERGHTQAQAFTWEVAARHHLRIYHHIGAH